MAYAGQIQVLAEVSRLDSMDAETNDDFGYSVDREGDLAVIGAPGDDVQGSGSGSVYLMERGEDANWEPLAKISPPNFQRSARFGTNVKLQGDRLFVGATELLQGSGTVYIYERNGEGTWELNAELNPDDAAAAGQFGAHLSLDDDRLAIGAPASDDGGAAYLFERDDSGNWSQVAKFFTDNVTGSFGTGVALDGDRLAVGASVVTSFPNSSGEAYLFERQTDGEWIVIQIVEASDAQPLDKFGDTVALEGDRLVVGAREDFAGGTGSAYVFERQGDGNWIEVDKLVDPTADEDSEFSSALALQGDQILLGAQDDFEAFNGSGSVSLFEPDGQGGFMQTAKFTPQDAMRSDAFGWSVAFDGDQFMVGAIFADADTALISGAVYSFETVTVDPQLSISGSCPGDIEITLDEGTPRDTVALYRGSELGSTTLAGGPCAGTELGLNSAVLLTQLETSFDPEIVILRSVSLAQCGLYLQLLDKRTCLASSPVQLPGSSR